MLVIRWLSLSKLPNYSLVETTQFFKAIWQKDTCIYLNALMVRIMLEAQNILNYVLNNTKMEKELITLKKDFPLRWFTLKSSIE